jgi:lysyl-tRNA synthetase class 2
MENQSQSSSELEVRRQKLTELKAHGHPYPARFPRTNRCEELLQKFGPLKPGESSSETVRIAGRLISKRDHGKSCFAHIYDGSDKIQIYARADLLGEKNFQEFSRLDLGDFIGVEGVVFRTHKGELTVQIKNYTLLAKTLRGLPEKFHGLKDKELRYRKRYLDLLVAPEVKKIFYSRSKIINLIREFLNKRGYLEVETPVLHDIAGGATARPFATYHNTYEMNLYLRIALELHLKRLIIGGFEKVYEIGRVFRNEGVSHKHNPEYTLLELYEAYGDYHTMMELAESLLTEVTHQIKGGLRFNYQGKEINLTPPWPKITMQEVISKFTGIDILKNSAEEIRKYLKTEGIEFELKANRGALIETLYEKKVEPNLIEPTFIYDYPVETSPLAKKKEDNPGLAERFELVISGMEIVNAFSELNDPLDQRARFEEQVAQKTEENPARVDEDFLEAIEHGLPPTGGLGLGVDRLVMLLLDAHSIREVLLFPYMKPAE